MEERKTTPHDVGGHEKRDDEKNLDHLLPLFRLLVRGCPRARGVRDLG